MFGRVPNDYELNQKIRANYFENARLNQTIVWEKQFEWMREFIRASDSILELGSSHGLSKEFLSYENLVTSDILDYPWIDKPNLDAHDIDYPDESFDVVFSHSVLHHLQRPLVALKEIQRVLKPGGYYLMEDVTGSLLMRLLLKITGHEDYDPNVNVFGANGVCCPKGPFQANNAIVDLLFREKDKLLSELGQLELIEHYYFGCLMHINSGGTTSFFPYIPLNRYLLERVVWLDKQIAKFAGKYFCIHQNAVFRKRIPQRTS